jgi:hypothetical protein
MDDLVRALLCEFGGREAAARGGADTDLEV